MSWTAQTDVGKAFVCKLLDDFLTDSMKVCLMMTSELNTDMHLCNACDIELCVVFIACFDVHDLVGVVPQSSSLVTWVELQFAASCLCCNLSHAEISPKWRSGCKTGSTVCVVKHPKVDFCCLLTLLHAPHK